MGGSRPKEMELGWEQGGEMAKKWKWGWEMAKKWTFGGNGDEKSQRNEAPNPTEGGTRESWGSSEQEFWKCRRAEP